jgi:hypothetical protein
MRMERREMKLSSVVLGTARVELRVAVEYDGLQIDLVHVGGGEARARVVFPEPLDFEVTTVYVDWERAPQPGVPHEVVLSAEKPKVELYGRCRPAKVRWPLAVPLALDARVRERGFELVAAASEVSSARTQGLATALAALTGVPARVRAFDKSSVERPHLGVSIDLATEPARERKERTLLSAMERFALER